MKQKYSFGGGKGKGCKASCSLFAEEEVSSRQTERKREMPKLIEQWILSLVSFFFFSVENQLALLKSAQIGSNSQPKGWAGEQCGSLNQQMLRRKEQQKSEKLSREQAYQ